MTVLITRPLAFAKRTECEFKAKGFDTWADPVLSIQPIPIECDVNAYDAIITTSMVAIDLIATRTPLRDIPLFCAGPASATFAKNLGFTTVFYPDQPGGKGLIPILLQSEYTRLAYIHGEIVKVDIAAKLHKLSNQKKVDTFCAYRTVAATAFSDETVKQLKNGTIKVVTFYSEYSAKVMLDLLRKHELLGLTPTLTALCISEAVAIVVNMYTWKSVSSIGLSD